jgi:uncharacterized protein YrzB (UPF0473 family)
MAEQKEKKDVKETEKEDDDGKHYIVLTDDQGKDTKVELLFSIVYHKTEERYLYVVDPGDEDAVIIFSADDDGNLEMIQEDKIDKELNAFLHQTFEAYLKGDLVPADQAEEEEEGEEDEEGECCCGEEKDGCGCGCEDEEKNDADCCCGGAKEKDDGECCCGHHHHPQVGDEK